MIKLNKVSKSFAEKKVLDKLDLSFHKNEVVCILGASGCGKSTLMKLASGLMKADSGKVKKLYEQKYSYVFQENRLLPWSSSLDNIRYLGVEEKRALEYLSLVGLIEEAEKFPHELSGGMQRRLAIARALAFGGDCFFLDEPLQGLDINTNKDMVKLINKELDGRTAIIITHSAEDAFSFADRIIVAKGIPFTVTYDCKVKDFRSAAEITSLIENNL